MIKLSLILAGLAICNAILAILMPWYVVTHLGVGIQTDAFFASGALPQLIFLVASFSLTQVLVPLLATEDEKTFRRDAWGFFLSVTGFFTLLAAALFVLADYWVPLLVPGFSDEAKQLTISLSRIQLLGMIGNASVAVLWSVYYAREKFLWAELSPVFANVLSLLFLFWTLPRYGIAAAAWATVLSLVLKLVFLMPLLGRWQKPQWDSYAMREAWRRLKPFLLGQTYSKSDPLIDRFLTSMSIAGDLSLLYIGQQIYSAINLIITKAISAPTVPRLALAAKSGDWRNFRRTYRQRLLWMAGLSIAACFVLLVFVLMGGTAGQITAVAFYAMGDTKTPTMLFVWTFTIYIPIKVLVFLHYGLLGLAIATSVHLIVNFMLQLIFLEQATALAALKRVRPA